MKSSLAILSIFLLVIMSTNTFPQDLVAYYPFNNNADDSSGNNNDGTVFGATLTADRFGNPNAAYSFDGIDDYIEVFNPNHLGLTSWTITGWINVPGDIPEEYNIVGKHENEYQKYNFGVLQKTGLTLFSQYEIDDDPTDFDHKVSYGPIATNEWFSFTSIRDAVTGIHALYVNGEIKSSDEWHDVPTTSQQNLLIGKHFSWGADYLFYEGLIDDIRIYNGALPTESVGLIYTLESIDIHHGILNSLWAKLNSALRSLSNGNTNAAINVLNAFINEVEAQQGKKISESDADDLIAKAQDLIYGINDEPFAKRRSIQYDTAIPEGYVMFQNYPNPFNPTTTIHFVLLEEAEVILEIFNSAGQRIATLLNKRMDAGQYNVVWDASERPSGIYFYSIKAGSFQDLKKMIFMK
ncbi:MAG: LamG-like jellyroll fold domain-containing protein [Candidatus Thorarchaeota archaeon]